jgi:hypothetical protein
LQEGITMADGKSPAGGADFVAKIVKDPKSPPDTTLLAGYLGASSEDGHTRLYFDPGLGSYVEIPDDAILHTEPVEGDRLGARHVWIKRDAVLIHGAAGSQRPKAMFLEGPIMQQHLAAAAPAPGAGQAMPGPMAGSIPCSLLCPSFATGCAQQAAHGGNPRSDFVACNSWICPPSANCPPSDFAPCQSLNCPPMTQPPACPSAFRPCLTPDGPCHPTPAVPCPPTPLAHCPPTPHLLCMTQQPHCVSAFIPCQTQQQLCHHTLFQCNTLQNQCPSVIVVCLSVNVCPQG